MDIKKQADHVLDVSQALARILAGHDASVQLLALATYSGYLLATGFKPEFDEQIRKEFTKTLTKTRKHFRDALPNTPGKPAGDLGSRPANDL